MAVGGVARIFQNVNVRTISSILPHLTRVSCEDRPSRGRDQVIITIQSSLWNRVKALFLVLKNCLKEISGVTLLDPLDGVIHPSNNRGLFIYLFRLMFVCLVVLVFFFLLGYARAYVLRVAMSLAETSLF